MILCFLKRYVCTTSYNDLSILQEDKTAYPIKSLACCQRVIKSAAPLYLRSKGLHDSQHTTSSKALFTPVVLKTSVYIECTGYASQVYKF